MALLTSHAGSPKKERDDLRKVVVEMFLDKHVEFKGEDFQAAALTMGAGQAMSRKNNDTDNSIQCSFGSWIARGVPTRLAYLDALKQGVIPDTQVLSHGRPSSDSNLTAFAFEWQS